jgi:AAA-ATPase Vps4-associated protein 1
VCKNHLKDKGFASPILDEKAEAEKRKKEAMDREIEKIKKEFEEKQKLRKGKKKAKDDEDKKKDDGEDDGKAEKERDEKVSLINVRLNRFVEARQIKAVQAGAKPESPAEDGPRVFALQRSHSAYLTLQLGVAANSLAGISIRCGSIESETLKQRNGTNSASRIRPSSPQLHEETSIEACRVSETDSALARKMELRTRLPK